MTPPRIDLALTRFGGRHARLTITDNGRPLPSGFDRSEDDAMLLVQKFSHGPHRRGGRTG